MGMDSVVRTLLLIMENLTFQFGITCNKIQGGMKMAESTDYLRKKKSRIRSIPFYGAVKSRNEVYFQMASLFKEVTKGESVLSGEWMDRILRSRTSPDLK